MPDTIGLVICGVLAVSLLALPFLYLGAEDTKDDIDGKR